MTVIIPEGGDGGDTSTAFAAGVATAEAAQAQEESAEAVALAEAATAVAETALEVAASAESDRWADRDAVDGLRGEIAELREDVSALLVRDEPPAVTVDDLAPEVLNTPEVPAETGETKLETPAAGHSKRSGYGSDRWFGRK